MCLLGNDQANQHNQNFKNCSINKFISISELISLTHKSNLLYPFLKHISIMSFISYLLCQILTVNFNGYQNYVF